MAVPVPDGVVLLPKAQKGEVFGMGFDLGEKESNSPAKEEEEISASMSVKVCLMGDKGAGKTSLQAFATGHSFSEKPQKTKKFTSKKVKVQCDSLDVAVEVSDPPSDCSFAKLTEELLDCDGVFVCFDISSMASFQKVIEYHEQLALALQTDKCFPMVLIGLKADLENEREIPQEEAKGLAKKYGIPYMECSAKRDGSFERHMKKMVKAVLSYYMPKQKSGSVCCIL